MVLAGTQPNVRRHVGLRNSIRGARIFVVDERICHIQRVTVSFHIVASLDVGLHAQEIDGFLHFWRFGSIINVIVDHGRRRKAWFDM